MQAAVSAACRPAAAVRAGLPQLIRPAGLGCLPAERSCASVVTIAWLVMHRLATLAADVPAVCLVVVLSIWHAAHYSTRCT